VFHIFHNEEGGPAVVVVGRRWLADAWRS
jgi:hypothetical protein